ncbi:Isobutyryl-CoA dehydrogenase, mitochondrial [Aspergillus nanangensis]|uniref:Isobutyryl-CoA dehydrogenase, mitochondrial n=1 Tax=Aspergillus nanangensis TaxID=2582783 RepID=A0AAD4CQK0_ASPNN|nr:Isobutyryl-CoA dehydrogenase, mitochondrial [Aspergillus nanangensis]
MAATTVGIKDRGSQIPYAEPPWLSDLPSPYIRDSHRRLQRAMREWVDKNLIPNASDWERCGRFSPDLYQACAEAGILMPMAAGKTIPHEWRSFYPIIGGIEASEWDGFHDFIIHDEMMRVGGIGIPNGLIGGLTLCLPALKKHGKGPAIERIIDEALSGQSQFSLAVTEPEAGSDVQGVTTTAILGADGTTYTVNGQKKVPFSDDPRLYLMASPTVGYSEANKALQWITGGMYAKYFLTLTRTVDQGFTLLVIPKDSTVTVRPMEMCGSACAGTAFVEFDDTVVPVTNRIGEHGGGLACVMSNFNHERLFISFQAMRCARMCLEDALSHAITRETFGQELVSHAVVRHKLAHMAREVEALHSWIETLIYQLGNLDERESTAKLAGQMAQLKAHSGIVLERVVSQGIQLMGGLGLTRGGRGERLERIWRDVKAITIPGGSEDILLDLSIRRAVRGLTGASEPRKNAKM